MKLISRLLKKRMMETELLFYRELLPLCGKGPEGAERASHADIQKASVPGRENSWCKGPGVGVCSLIKGCRAVW